MQKTKLGITVGLLGACVYFTGLFGGYLAVIVLSGYVLFFEENEWLRKGTVKSVVLLAAFSLLTTLLNLIPDTIEFINSFMYIFGENFSIPILSKIITVVTSAVDIIRKIIFIGLGMKAFNQGDISIPFVDKLINKYVK